MFAHPWKSGPSGQGRVSRLESVGASAPVVATRENRCSDDADSLNQFFTRTKKTVSLEKVPVRVVGLGRQNCYLMAAAGQFKGNFISAKTFRPEILRNKKNAHGARTKAEIGKAESRNLDRKST